MATILDKSVIRESSICIGEREILITLGDNQTISMKLKGMKSGEVSISIVDLYNQLTNNISLPELGIEMDNKVEKLDKTQKDNPTISLYDLRTKFATKPMSFELHAMFDGVIASCIRDKRNPVLAAELLTKDKKL